MNLRIAIVEDEPRVLAGLVELVNTAPGMTCVGSFLTAQAAMPKVLAYLPDILLIDLGLPGQTGEELIRALRPQLPDVKLVVLTQHENRSRIFEALQAGADGYLLKKDPPAKLLRAIQDAAEGCMPMSPGVAARVLDHFRNQEHRQPTKGSSARDGLSPREHEVLGLLAKGFSYKELAETLNVSLHTVNTYTKGIYKKLHVHSRAQAVAGYLAH